MPEAEVVSTEGQDPANLLTALDELSQFDSASRSAWDERAIKTRSEKVIYSLNPVLERVKEHEERFSQLEVEELKDKFSRIRRAYTRLEANFGKQEALDRLCPEVFALVRVVAEKTIGMRPYDIQVTGGILLHKGIIVEQKTGEGKTLTATMPLVLNSLTGEGVHLVTTNSYLARVGVQWMGSVYDALGLKVGVITSDKPEGLGIRDGRTSFVYDSNPPEESRIPNPHFERLRPVARNEAYEADITYGVNSEFGFDYLRDNMVLGPSLAVQRRPSYFAIVDEVDSILIDEARTSLIIETPEGRNIDRSELFRQANEIVRELRKGEHYEIDEEKRIVMVDEKQGWEKIKQVLSIVDDEVLFTEKFEIVTAVNLALQAKELFHRDQDYIVEEKGIETEMGKRLVRKIVLVDAFTGRPMPDRRYRGGLHEALEAKEGADIGKTSQTLAEITLPEYFSMYSKLTGMTGTAATAAEEFYRVYDLDVLQLPTNVQHRAVSSTDLRAVKEQVDDGVARMVYQDSKTNKTVLNQMIDFPDEIYKGNIQKYLAIIKEVKSLIASMRPVLIGTVTVEESNALARILWEKGVKCHVLNAEHLDEEADIIAQAGLPGAVTIATNMAGRGVDILLGGNPEGLARQELAKQGIDWNKITQREWNRAVRELRQSSDLPQDIEGEQWAQILKGCWGKCATHREIVRSAGGLHIIGTQKQMDRRVDNQLRGRTGRQGDPGSSRLYLSLEDEIMRRFAKDEAEKLQKKYSDAAGVIEDAEAVGVFAIAQKRAESFGSQVRQYVRKFGDVVGEQREEIYAQRNNILKTEGVNDFQPIVVDAAASLLSEQLFPLRAKDVNLTRKTCENLSAVIPTLDKDKLVALVEGNSRANEQEFAVIVRKEVEEACQQHFRQLPKMLSVRLADGSSKQISLAQHFRVSILKWIIDPLWVEQLTNIERIREGIGLRAVGRQDPLVSFQQEAGESYNRMINIIREEIVRLVFTKDLDKAKLQERYRRFKIMQALKMLMGGEIKTQELHGVRGQRLRDLAVEALYPKKELVEAEE